MELLLVSNLSQPPRMNLPRSVHYKSDLSVSFFYIKYPRVRHLIYLDECGSVTPTRV